MSLLALTPGGLLADVGRSLREGFYMFWDTLWALVLGFTISGAIQATVSREAMRRRLGDHRPASVVRAALYGAASSSCSYAASAMARSLFARGADFVASMVFLFASTNLVVELGVVLALLIGWEFLVAEFVGGAIMIGLLAVLGGFWFRGAVLQRARSKAESASAGWGEADERGADWPVAELAQGRDSWRRRMRTVSGWADAAGYTMSDLTMLRRELVIGFTVAGFLTVLVPAHMWADVLLQGHGFWTSLENSLVGPLVALASFVCSIGNVPLAAALWHGGTSFGGVVAFVFADLITLPLLLVYRKQYGGRMALRMLALFWPVMSAAGLATEYLFKAFGWVPSARPGVVAGDTLRWNYTTGLDMVFLALFAGLYFLYRRHGSTGAGAGAAAGAGAGVAAGAGAGPSYVKDPVCGMQVEAKHAPASLVRDQQRYWFCSEGCAERFATDPARYRRGRGGAPADNS